MESIVQAVPGLSTKVQPVFYIFYTFRDVSKDVLFPWAKSTLFRLEGSIPFNTKL